MRPWALLGAGLALSACANVEQRYYTPDRFQTMPWARKSFEAARAGCRYDNMAKKDLYTLNTEMYQACMEKQGFRYRASNGGMYDNLPPASPSTPSMPQGADEADKSALYR